MWGSWTRGLVGLVVGVGGVCLSFSHPVQAAGALTPLLVADGATNGASGIPCNGVLHWVARQGVYGYIGKAYLFASMSPNGINGLDAILWSPSYGGWGALADVHLMAVTPSQAIQGQNERTFSPDSIFVSNYVEVGVICWGGGTALVYAEVFVRASP